MDNFETRHGKTSLTVVDGRLAGAAENGSTFVAQAPFGRRVTTPSAEALAEACAPPVDWGVLLVRKGGFAVARLEGDQVVESKVGQRHVQGRTKAGGQSQRFARRRDNQARAAYEAAADHAARIAGSVPVLVVGGDRSAVEMVLADDRLADARVLGQFLVVPDPRRSVLEWAIREACCAQVGVTNA